MEYTFFHWGFHPWAMYAVIGLAIGYFAYRKGYGNLMSGGFGPLLGERAKQGPGKAIDVVAIFATLFGSATSLGLGRAADHRRPGQRLRRRRSKWVTRRRHRGADRVLRDLGGHRHREGGAVPVERQRGRRGAAGVLPLRGGSDGVHPEHVHRVHGWLPHLPADDGVPDRSVRRRTWINGWTVFYWAWWISWTPFVGMFIARISKGRTIRQFVIYVVLVPSLVSFVWFSIMGGAAFDLQLSQGQGPRKVLANEGTESVLFETLREYPLAAHHGGARDLAHRDLLHHRRGLGLDRDGHAQPARQGGAEAVADHLLGCRPGRGRLGAAVVRRTQGVCRRW